LGERWALEERVTLLLAGDLTKNVSVVPRAEGLLVRVEGEEYLLELRPTSPGVFVLGTGSRAETVYCVRDKGTIHLFLRGVAYRFAEARETFAPGARSAVGGLEAPMPGKVIRVRVKQGEVVAKGQEILVVEAMKMENAVRAPREGTIGKVHVKEGDMVAPGSVLVELS